MIVNNDDLKRSFKIGIFKHFEGEFFRALNLVEHHEPSNFLWFIFHFFMVI